MEEDQKEENSTKDSVLQVDYYFENGLMIMTEAYHLKRGECCGNKCRHCPYNRKNVKKDQGFTFKVTIIFMALISSFFP